MPTPLPDGNQECVDSLGRRHGHPTWSRCPGCDPAKALPKKRVTGDDIKHVRAGDTFRHDPKDKVKHVVVYDHLGMRHVRHDPDDGVVHLVACVGEGNADLVARHAV